MIREGEKMNLGTQNKRVIKIISMFTYNNQSLSSTNIATLLGISSKTVRKDIKECNTVLLKYGAKFLAVPSIGIVLKIYNNEKFTELKNMQEIKNSFSLDPQNIILSDHNDRIAFIIKKLFLNALSKRKITETELADELYISLSTLKKYIKDNIFFAFLNYK